jgi:hypothetical protein
MTYYQAGAFISPVDGSHEEISGAFIDSGQRLDNPGKAGSAGSGAVALGDMDSDGDLDAVVATEKGASIWMNQGGAQGGQTGIFAASGQRLKYTERHGLALGDFDADGDLDVFSAAGDEFRIWLNQGDGQLQAQN